MRLSDQAPELRDTLLRMLVDPADAAIPDAALRRAITDLRPKLLLKLASWQMWVNPTPKNRHRFLRVRRIGTGRNYRLSVLPKVGVARTVDFGDGLSLRFIEDHPGRRTVHAFRDAEGDRPRAGAGRLSAPVRATGRCGRRCRRPCRLCRLRCGRAGGHGFRGRDAADADPDDPAERRAERPVDDPPVVRGGWRSGRAGADHACQPDTGLAGQHRRVGADRLPAREPEPRLGPVPDPRRAVRPHAGAGPGQDRHRGSRGPGPGRRPDDDRRRENPVPGRGSRAPHRRLRQHAGRSSWRRSGASAGRCRCLARTARCRCRARRSWIRPGRSRRTTTTRRCCSSPLVRSGRRQSQKVSTQGRSSISQLQALRCWRWMSR